MAFHGPSAPDDRVRVGGAEWTRGPLSVWTRKNQRSKGGVPVTATPMESAMLREILLLKDACCRYRAEIEDLEEKKKRRLTM